MVMELTKEGERIASRLMETLRSFVLDTVREEIWREGIKSDLRSSKPVASDVSCDLLRVIKELFVVRPGFVRDHVGDIDACNKEYEHAPQIPNSAFNLSNKKGRQGKHLSSEKNKRLVSKHECKEVNKLKVINRGVIFDDAACSKDGLDICINGGEPDYAMKKTFACTKVHDCHLQNGAGLIRKCDSRDGEGDRYKLSEHNSEFGREHNLFDSADSGVFLSMGGMSYGHCEEAFSTDGEVLTKLATNSNGQQHKMDSPKSPEETPSTYTNVKCSNSREEPRMLCHSRIPVLSKSRRNSLATNNQHESNWMDSLQESIQKFKEYDFGATSNPDKPMYHSFDRSTSMEYLDDIEATNRKSKGRNLKSAQSMVNLSHISPRLDESTSFWKQRTSLEQIYSQYLEDEKQVLKDVKCDIEYEEANDIAKRRLRETKRGISRSLFDISAFRQPKVCKDVSPQTRKSKHNLTKAKSLSSLGCSEAQGSRNTNKLMDNRLSSGKSKIPVFIGHV